MGTELAVEDRLIALLGKTLGPDAVLSPATNLVGDLGLESIQVIEYLCEVEDHFDLAIDEATLADVQTIGDLAAVIRKLGKD
ncbi:MAG: acyl carrier protein [Gammaproteobacteria bacterium]|nr:acyl carrier protein [Gammaproteobacteria bacterium]